VLSRHAFVNAMPSLVVLDRQGKTRLEVRGLAQGREQEIESTVRALLAE